MALLDGCKGAGTGTHKSSYSTYMLPKCFWQFIRIFKCRLKDPLPYVGQYPEADILTSSDHLVGNGMHLT